VPLKPTKRSRTIGVGVKTVFSMVVRLRLSPVRLVLNY